MIGGGWGGCNYSCGLFIDRTEKRTAIVTGLAAVGEESFAGSGTSRDWCVPGNAAGAAAFVFGGIFSVMGWVEIEIGSFLGIFIILIVLYEKNRIIRESVPIGFWNSQCPGC